jgi:hypothetical protein
MRTTLTAAGTILDPRERQLVLRALKKGPAVDREELEQFLQSFIRAIGIDLRATSEEKMRRWKNGTGTYNKPGASETYLY